MFEFFLGASYSSTVLPHHIYKNLYTNQITENDLKINHIYLISRPDCPACLRYLNELDCLSGLMNGQTRVKTWIVATDDTKENLKRYFYKYRSKADILYLPSLNSLHAQWKFKATPGLLWIDPTGQIIKKVEGFKRCNLISI